MKHEHYIFLNKMTRNCCFMEIKVSPHEVEFSGVFLKLINIYIFTESVVFIILYSSHRQKRNLRKTAETVFRKCSASNYPVKLCKIQMKVNVPLFHLNIVVGLPFAT